MPFYKVSPTVAYSGASPQEAVENAILNDVDVTEDNPELFKVEITDRCWLHGESYMVHSEMAVLAERLKQLPYSAVLFDAVNLLEESCSFPLTDVAHAIEDIRVLGIIDHVITSVELHKPMQQH